nr:Laminin B type IV and EGF and Immunoglobulin V-set and Immunoglobulin and Immunoglobulin I-set and Laminin G domain containing protein [Haemonchus contortus]
MSLWRLVYHMWHCQVEINYPRGDRDQLLLTTSDIRQPYHPPTPPYLSGRAIEFVDFSEAVGQVLYWKMPAKFLGNKVTAYGGTLKFTFTFSGQGRMNQDPDVIIRGNDITLQYKHRIPIYPDRENTIELKIFEDRWQRVDGQQGTREHLLMALADLDDLLIKATYMEECSQTSLISVSLEYAEPHGTGLTAYEVEQCQCPPGYIGTSCEDCAPGYSRTGGGLYLGLCERCECHGHASQCDKEYGFCVDCQHNTEGDQCERCKPGFIGDARRGTPHDCQPAATRPPCHCNNHSPRGCDSFGRCLLCEHNTEGTHCERCKKGFYGDATKGTPYDCTPCPCPGAADCYLDSQGQVACRNCPAGLAGRLCDECAPGYTRSHKIAGRPCEPIGHVGDRDRTYVPPAPPHEAVGRPPQPVVDPLHLTVNENEPAAYRCWVPGIPDCQITWHKERIGGALPHGVYQTGNALKIPRAQLHDAGNYVCTAVNDFGIGQSPPARLDVVRPAQRPKIDPVEQTVNDGEPARFRCWVPGNPEAELKWHRIGHQPLPASVQEHQGILHIPRASQHEAGQYVCTATDPRDRRPQDSDPATLHVREPEAPTAPQVDPVDQTVNEGDPAQFRCWVPGNPQAVIRWRKKDGGPLPAGTLDRDGFLRFTNTKKTDAGEYVCTATDPRGGPPTEAPPARLNVNPTPTAPQVDPPSQTVDEGQPASIRCWVPGNPRAQLRWTKHGRQPLPPHAHERDGVLTIPQTSKSDEGHYVCTAFDPETRVPTDAPPAHIGVRQPTKLQPQVDPIEQSIPEGSPFRIRCWVPGNPHVDLSWRRPQGEINDDSTQDRGILTVNRAELTDDGEYLCTAEDPRTGQKAEAPPATVHVTQPTRVPDVGDIQRKPEITPPQQTVPEGDPASIRCWVEGDPQARLSFKRADGAPIPFGASDLDGVLAISSTLKSDEGDYICTYHPADGSTPKDSTPSKLIVETPGEPPRPVATPPVLTVKRGHTAQFHCEANSPTPAQIKWGHGDADSELPDGANHELDDIMIDSADDHHEGEYVCSATNEFGTGVAEPVQLNVVDDEQPPTARVEPRVWNGKPGDKHQFKCHVTGVPTPKVTWSGPNNSPLPHDVTELEGNILDFSNGRTELNGDYTCTATNPVGEATDYGSVNIGPSLTVKTTPAGPRLILTVGEPLSVKCEAFGEPEPEVEWLYDPGPERGDLPDDYKPVTIAEQFIKHPAIGLGNAGAYTCKGSNSHATATKNIYVEVVEPSRVATVSILGGSSQWFEQGESSELICTATGSSLVDRLEWVKVDDQLPTDVEEHNEPGLLHFPNFKNSYAGEYECRGYRNNELIASSSVQVYSSTDDTEDVKVEIEPPRVRIVSQGENIVLKCTVQGAKNGQHFEWALLRGGNIVRKLGNEATLEVKGADPTNDYGVYRCNVEDDNGVVIGSAYTAVSVGYSDRSNAQVVKFDEKSDAVFTCPIYSVPGSKVEWSRVDGDLPPGALPNGNRLEIKDFDDAAAGMYKCTVTFDNHVVEGFVDAQIFVPDTIIQVLLDVSSESVNVGDRAWFDCKVTGDPSAVISWSKEGADELPDNSQVTGGRLLFNEVTEDNAGVYKCRAKTKAGPLETRTVLNIGSAKRESEPLPVVKSVGEEAFLSCGSTLEDATVARWEKLDGNLPKNAVTDRGVLRLPSLDREAEGLYQCTAVDNDTSTKSVIELQVDDFVPTFFGRESLVFPPMTDEQIRNIEVVLAVNPRGEDGVIFETTRRPSLAGEDPATITRPPNIEHRARIDHGVVVYEYNVGYGKESLTSPNAVLPHEWNTIRLINNDTKAVLQLNSGPPIIKPHHPTRFEQGANGPVYLGGHVEPTDPDHTHQGFKGVISSMTVSGKPVDLGSVVRSPHMVSHDSCAHVLCLHSSRCRNANIPKGYECICPLEYTGEHCERRSAFCRDEDCNSGVCEEVGDTWQCVCPLNATGLRCEVPVHTPLDGGLGFGAETSFMTMPRPKDLDHFQVSMSLKPQDVELDHMLLYVGADYDPDSKTHMSVSVTDGSIVYSYNDGEGREELRSVPIEPGVEYTVVLSRNDSTTSLIVNGQMFERENELKTFEPGTDLFVGGLPPGLDIPDDVPATSFFGCINKINVDGVELDINNQSAFSSGDISQCVMVEQVFPTKTFTPEVPETPSPTEATTTEEPVHVYETDKDSDAPEPIIPKVDEFEEQEVKEEVVEIVEELVTGVPLWVNTTEEVILELSPELMPTVQLSTDDPCTSDGIGEACLSKVCIDHGCGPNGECIAVNQTYYRCQCKLYYDGPRCDLFKPIERAAKFDGNAFLEISADDFPHLTSEKLETVDLKFKTTESEGVIFWQGQQPGTSVVGEDYFSVGLSNGHLHFSYELGGGAAYMVSESRVDDNKEHHIRLERQGRRGVLKVDNQVERSGVSSGILAMLNADGNIFIGGVRDVYRDTGGLHSKNFIGCIADVALNGEIIDLMGNAIDGKNVKPCDEWISPRRRWFKGRRRLRSWTIL